MEKADAPAADRGAAILARVEGGEVLSVKAITSTIADAKRRESDERQEAARLERLSPEARRRRQREKERQLLKRERDNERLRQELAEREAAARAAADLLVDRLGDDLAEFMEMMNRAGLGRLSDALPWRHAAAVRRRIKATTRP